QIVEEAISTTEGSKKKKKKSQKNTEVDEKTEMDPIYELPSSKKNKKIWIISSIATAAALILALFSTGFALANSFNDGIVSGITINDINLRGLNRDEAMQKVTEALSVNLDTEIAIIAEEFETSFHPSQIEARFNIEEMVNEAYGIGRNGNIFQNNFRIMMALMSNINIEPELIYNEELLEYVVTDIKLRLPGQMLQAKHYIEGNNLIIVGGAAGHTITAEETKGLIIEEIKTNSGEVIELDLMPVYPDPIDIDEIYYEIFREPQDAYYIDEPFEVIGHVNGITFDLEAARQIIEEEEREEYVIPLIITAPRVTVRDLGPRIFNDVLRFVFNEV
ncbi:MAG: peptidoglycan binding domain-containing protein, partial [Oscillospiraceae bacterium]|nr:peptidoglycan binding domain-containing protein [Oscillospiraceae bacterium]